MQVFKITSLYFFIFLIIVLGTACANQSEGRGYTLTVKDNELVNNNLEDLLINSVEKIATENNLDISKIKNFEVTEVNRELDIVISTFMFNIEKELFHGFLIANELNDEQYQFHDLEFYKVTSDKISLFNYIGTKPGAVEQKMYLTSGYVNDKNIKKVYITYEDERTTALILIEEQPTFTEIRIGGEAKVKSILGISQENEILYEK